MADYNRVILLGRLTRDVELKYTASNLAVTELGLAVTDRRRNANGENVEETTFVDVTLWGRQAEVASEYLNKGSPVFIEGRLKLDQWEDKQSGQKRSKLRVVGERGRPGVHAGGERHPPGPPGRRIAVRPGLGERGERAGGVGGDAHRGGAQPPDLGGVQVDLDHRRVLGHHGTAAPAEVEAQPRAGQQDDVGAQPARKPRRLFAAADLGDAVEVALLAQQRAKAFADDGVVIDDHEPGLADHWKRALGMRLEWDAGSKCTPFTRRLFRLGGRP